MSDLYITDETFTAERVKDSVPGPGIYDGCRFERCDFSGADLSGFQFIDCQFDSCNLAGANLAGTGIRQTKFSHCKLTGIHFENCHPVFFDPVFEQCRLDFSSFFRKKLTGKSLAGCSLKEVDFSEADLSGVDFSGADLEGAVFSGTQLEHADFRDAVHFHIDPEKNKLKKARFRLDGLAGLVGKYELLID